MSLIIYVPDKDLRNEYQALIDNRRWTDSGFDLASPKMTLDFRDCRYGAEMPLGAHFAALDYRGEPVPFLLLARSSMSLTPLRMSNQIGLADAGYRGQLIARVDCISDEVLYPVAQGRRLFQVVQHNWLPWNKIVLVDKFERLPKPQDDRGSGGFGSTGQ